MTQIAANHLAAHQFTYSSAATTTLYGTLCHANASISSDRPFAGDEFYQITAGPASFQELVVFVIGFAPTNVPLGSLGFAAGCSLAVDLNGAILLSQINPNLIGTASLSVPLPDAPLFIGDLFVQAAIWPGGGTPFVTRGLGIQVR